MLRSLALSASAAAALAVGGVAAAGTASAAEAPSTAPAASQAASYGSCDLITLRGKTYIFYHSGQSCSAAKKLARRVRSQKRGVSGYSCESGSNFTSGASCSKGSKYFGWHPGD